MFREKYSPFPILSAFQICCGFAPVRTPESEAVIFVDQGSVSRAFPGVRSAGVASSQTVRSLGLLAGVIYSVVNELGCPCLGHLQRALLTVGRRGNFPGNDGEN